MEYVSLVLTIIAIALLGVLLVYVRRLLSSSSLSPNFDVKTQLDHITELQNLKLGAIAEGMERLEGQLRAMEERTDGQIRDIRGIVDDKLSRTLAQQTTSMEKRLTDIDSGIRSTNEAIATRLAENTETQRNSASEVRKEVNEQLSAIRSDNAQQLEKMRATVDEKLTDTLNNRLAASFSQVSEQLEKVYSGIGSMQSIASEVGDLKHVLSNVKTRGIMGEVQLGAILSDILTPAQYLENVATKKGSNERVEFAVKLPVEEGEPILLPIDAKFPGESYHQVLDAIDSGDKATIDAARKNLVTRIRQEAKDISEKYISTPDTTNFGILFLPFEGLYAEVVNRPGLIEELQREFRINVAGPSTMAAILNSLQMSFQTFALQKKTDEVMRVLAAVRGELPRYQKELERAQKQIDLASKTVGGIITTRTNVMERKLRNIGTLSDGEDPSAILGLPPIEEPDDEV